MRTILLDKRDVVVANIREAVRRGDLNAKVEPDDPDLTPDEKRAICESFVDQYPTWRFRCRRRLARSIINVVTRMVNRNTKFVGLENIKGISGGAIVTSNHFSPIDNTVVRLAMHKAGKWRLPIVCQESNLAMPALFGFMMRYADTLPISADRHYMRNHFKPILEDELARGNYVLIYPEQEMWFNYRKPRPCKRGAYYYAARFNVPIISCFVEIVDKDDLQSPDFVEVSYVMHVLDPIYPDPALSVRENSVAMCKRDYAQKCQAYERIYGKPVDYRFSPDDVAGWIPPQEPHGSDATGDDMRVSAQLTSA